MKNKQLIFLILYFFCSSVLIKSSTKNSNASNNVNFSSVKKQLKNSFQTSIKQLDDEYNKELHNLNLLNQELFSLELKEDSSKVSMLNTTPNRKTHLDLELDNNSSTSTNTNAHTNANTNNKLIKNKSEKKNKNNKLSKVNIAFTDKENNKEDSIKSEINVNNRISSVNSSSTNNRDNAKSFKLTCVESEAINKIKPEELENKTCQIKSGKIKYITKIDINKRSVDCTPVLGKLTRQTLSVYLDNKANSIIGSIRLEEVEIAAKTYGLNIDCVELTSKNSPANNNGNNLSKSKSISLCFDNDSLLKEWVKAIKEMKRCSLTFENSEVEKLRQDYIVLNFLQEKQYEITNGDVSDNSNNTRINEKLKENYYENDLEKLNQRSKYEEDLINKVLDDLMEQSMAEQAKAQSRERQVKQEQVNKDTKSKTRKTSKNSTEISESSNKNINNQVSSSNNNNNKLENQESVNQSIIKELKQASMRVTNNICVNNSNNASNNISHENFREGICKIIKNESKEKVECFTDSLVKFCTVCCQHISNNKLNLLEHCMGECSK